VTCIATRDGTLRHPAELVILDKDGTLIDVHHYWVSMIGLRAQRICRDLALLDRDRETLQAALCDAMGVDPTSQRLRPEGPVGVLPRPAIVDTVCAALGERGHATSAEATEVVEAAFAAVDAETRSDLGPLLELLPGVAEFLDQCRSRGVHLAIATTDLSTRAQEAMRALGLADRFELICGAEQVERTKPAPDLGQLITRKMGVDLRSVVVIGDHPVDMEMGRSMGASCNIAVLTGLGRRDAFRSLDCHVVASFEELRVE